MTPQELKNSILLLAVNGQLIPQNPCDESAIVFVNQIRAEQKRLLSVGAIKKEKYNPIIENDEDLPDGWCIAKLGELTSVVTKQTGFDYSKTIKPNLSVVRRDGMIPMVQTKNFKGTVFDLETDYYIPLSVASSFPKILLDSKCMLLSIVGASIGNVGIYNGRQIAMIGGAICKVSLLDDRLYDYLYYYLQSPLGQQEITKNLKATAQGTITVQDVREIAIKMPPLAEQKRIVAKIEELLPLVDRYEKAWSRLEDLNKRFPADMQKAILQMAIEGKLVEQRPEESTGEELYKKIQAEKQKLIKAGKLKKEKPLPEITEKEIPFEIPESWKWVRLGDCSSYAQTKEKIAADVIPPSVWSLDLEDIEKESGKITKCCKAASKSITGDKVLFYKGQILYSKLRPYLKKILVAPDDGICSPELVPFSVYGKIEAQYLVYVLKTPHIDYTINSVTYGVKMPRVGTETMVNLLIPLPPLAEQKRIVAKIEELLPLCEKLK